MKVREALITLFFRKMFQYYDRNAGSNPTETSWKFAKMCQLPEKF